MTPARSSDGLTENQKGLLYALCRHLSSAPFSALLVSLTHSGIDAGQLLAQRIVWSALFSVGWWRGLSKTHVLLDALRRPKTLLVFTCSATGHRLGTWLGFSWAISNNHVLEASFGLFYFAFVQYVVGAAFFQE